MSTDPCEPQVQTSTDGARLEGCAHGGHITRWWPAGSEDSKLWMSPRSSCGPGTAMRGGVPVIFPQFAAMGPLPKHGYVRDRPWEPIEPSAPSDAAMLRYRTTVEPTDVWPHHAEVVLAATATGPSLSITLAVTNTGDAPLEFTGALHAYFTVSSTSNAGIDGLFGKTARDSMAGGAETTLPMARLSTAGPMDYLVSGAADPVLLCDLPRPPLAIVTDGFNDRVVWNPGAGHGLPDVADGDETGFVCVEPAMLDPVQLGPGVQWIGRVDLTALG